MAPTKAASAQLVKFHFAPQIGISDSDLRLPLTLSSCEKSGLLCVVIDNTERIAPPRGHPTDAMTHGGLVIAAFPLNGSVLRGENDHFPLCRGNCFGARLRPRSLLDQEKRTARVVVVGPTEKAGELQRERHLTIEILMQTVVTAAFVTQEQGRRPRLPRRPTLIEKGL